MAAARSGVLGGAVGVVTFTGIAHALMGSVAETVVRTSERPVLTWRSPQPS